MATRSRAFVVCVRNDGYEASLERRKLYVVVADAAAADHGQVRVIDESGDDYLYPANYFAAIDLPQAVRKAVIAAA